VNITYEKSVYLFNSCGLSANIKDSRGYYMVMREVLKVKR